MHTYITEYMTGVPQNVNQSSIEIILKTCLSDGFNFVESQARNDQQLFFNLGYKINEFSQYEITDGVNIIFSYCEQLDDNNILIKKDISNMAGVIKIRPRHAGLEMIETTAELQFLLKNEFKFIYKKNSSFISIENKNGVRSNFDFAFDFRAGAAWSVFCIDDESIFIKMPRSSGEYNVNVITMTGSGCFLSYARDGHINDGFFLGHDSNSSVRLSHFGKEFSASTSVNPDKNIYISNLICANDNSALSNYFYSLGNLKTQTEQGKDEFLYKDNFVFIVFYAYSAGCVLTGFQYED